METNNKRRIYTAPIIEVIKIEEEGIIAYSGGNGNSNIDMEPGTWSIAKSPYNSPSVYETSNELEDMINDILTYKK